MVIVESKRDQRVLDWLIAQVGQEAVDRACAGLGTRRPYVSNVAKALGLKPPESLQRTPKDEALAHIARIRQRLAEPPVK